MLIDALLPLALACIMFSLGIGLVTADFSRLLYRPKAVALGLFGQIIGLPLLAFGLLEISGSSGSMAVGVMILAACPGGASSGLLTALARGDTALSITLTAISSVAALFTLPFVVDRSLGHFLATEARLALPLMRTVGSVFLITALPVGLGMLLRQKRPDLTRRLEKPLGRLSTALFILIVLATFLSQKDVLLDHLPHLGPLLCLLNLLTMGGGYGLARLGHLGHPAGLAIAMECGLQNAALGIFVASVLLQTPALAIPSIVYAFLMNAGALGLVVILRHFSGRLQTAPEAG